MGICTAKYYTMQRYLMKHKLNTDRMRDISITMMQVATRFERRQNNAKMITLYCAKYKCTMYIKLLNVLNKLFQLGNIA